MTPPDCMERGGYEWVTTFTVRHEAGSQEGAIHQRNLMDKAIEEAGGKVHGAITRPGNTGAASVEALMRIDEEAA